jgi:hypothetical protein
VIFCYEKKISHHPNLSHRLISLILSASLDFFAGRCSFLSLQRAPAPSAHSSATAQSWNKKSRRCSLPRFRPLQFLPYSCRAPFSQHAPSALLCSVLPLDTPPSRALLIGRAPSACSLSVCRAPSQSSAPSRFSLAASLWCPTLAADWSFAHVFLPESLSYAHHGHRACFPCLDLVRAPGSHGAPFLLALLPDLPPLPQVRPCSLLPLGVDTSRAAPSRRGPLQLPLPSRCQTPARADSLLDLCSSLCASPYARTTIEFPVTRWAFCRALAPASSLFLSRSASLVQALSSLLPRLWCPAWISLGRSLFPFSAMEDVTAPSASPYAQPRRARPCSLFLVPELVLYLVARRSLVSDWWSWVCCW